MRAMQLTQADGSVIWVNPSVVGDWLDDVGGGSRLRVLGNPEVLRVVLETPEEVALLFHLAHEGVLPAPGELDSVREVAREVTEERKNPGGVR